MIEAEATVIVRGAGGKLNNGRPVGRKGILRDNLLKLRSAVYYENLPVDYLISIGDLCLMGWGVMFKNGASYATNDNTGLSLPIVR